LLRVKFLKKEGVKIRPETERVLKEKQIKQEISRLKKICKDLGKERVKMVEGLISEAAFMKITLEETRKVINEEGTTEVFEQGKQKFIRKHPALEVYTTLVNRYSIVMKQIIDLLPEAEKKKVDDELTKFIKRNYK